jgi:DNA-binding NarL/FixJ family response regulator
MSGTDNTPENIVRLAANMTPAALAFTSYPAVLAANDAPPAKRVAPMRLLVVDDHVLFRGGLIRLFDPQPDMQVVGEAGTRREAVALALTLNPDVILMDAHLPDGSGHEAARDILETCVSTKIVFLTVDDSAEQLFAALRVGVVGYLPKSVDPGELLAKLRGLARDEAAVTPALTSLIIKEFSRLPALQPTPSSNNKLTSREIDMIRALTQGATNREIAEQFVISENTVRNHIQNILNKLQLHSRHDVVEYARTHGLISPASSAPHK